MKHKGMMITGLLAVFIGGCVHTVGRDADRTGVYYDRPGVTVAEARADKLACRTRPGSDSAVVLARSPDLAAVADQLADKALTQCMRDKGYARLVVSGPAVKVLTDMAPAERDKALQALMDANESPAIIANAGAAETRPRRKRRRK